MKNLKAILMELGNRLVTEQKWLPAAAVNPDVKEAIAREKSTQPIVDFTQFLNDNPEAVSLLAQLGLEWPVVKPSTDDDDIFAGEVLTPRTCSLDDEECTSCQ